MADQGQAADLLWSSEARLDLLGPVRLGNSAGDDLTPKSRKTRALLAVVALSKGPVSRARLTDLLWGDRGEDQARASLRQALYELRMLASSGYVKSDRESVSLGPKRLPTDLSEIHRLINERDADGLAEALGRVGSPILASLDDITPELDDWLRDERSRIGSGIISDAIAMAETCPASGRRLADELERLDPLDENVARLGMRGDLAAGDRPAAMRRHARLAARLKDQLGIEPSAETDAVLKGAMTAPAATASAAPASSAEPPRRQWGKYLPALAALVLVLAALGLYALLRPSSAAATPTVAVLPFEGLGKSDDNHFAAGVSDEILNLLSHQNRFRILGRVSAEEVAHQPNMLAEARRLGITHLLDGSVQSDGKRLLVIVRLTSTADGTQLWSERYERQAGDIFDIQGDIANAVASRMALSLGSIIPQQTSPEVYDRYLAARQLERDRREANLIQAQKLLKEAIALDDRYAPAYAELSQVTMLLANHPASWGEIPYAQARAEAETYARKAVALDPNLGDGWASLGFLNYSDRRSAPYYARAVALSPQRADFHRWYAQSLKDAHKYDQAIDEYKRAVAIDPLWGINYDHLVGALMELGRDAEAKSYTRRFLSLSTDPRAKLMFLRSIANFEFRLADSLRYARELYASYPDERQSRLALGGALATIGNRREATSVSQGDPIGQAVLSANWDALAKAARAAGPGYWDIAANLWNSNSLLVASGHGDVVLQLYDEAQPAIQRGDLLRDTVTGIDTVLALRAAGRKAEADRLEQVALARMKDMPDVGYARTFRGFTIMFQALYSGQRERGLTMLEQIGRESPQQLLTIPAMSLRWSPIFKPLAGDPRFEAVDEKVRAVLNRERAKAGLTPLSREAWISDQKTLLTKN
jgi:DNA-binding SARP family transcriptional activator/TolB-like protein/Tfp pilus assembly protein PilF